MLADSCFCSDKTLRSLYALIDEVFSVLIQKQFNTNGTLKLVVGDLLTTTCDVIANSFGPKEKPIEAYKPRGILEHQFAEKGGPALVAELESAEHGTWGFGDIIFTPSHKLNQGEGSPQDICHFCVPRSYEGALTLMVSKNQYFCTCLQGQL